MRHRLGRRALIAAALAGLVAAAARAQDAPISLGQAVGRLARERSFAESGAGLLKAYAGRDAAAMARGQQLYAAAKAASDGLVERLLVAVREGDDPGRSADREAAMSEAVERRVTFSRHVEGHLPQ